MEGRLRYLLLSSLLLLSLVIPVTAFYRYGGPGGGGGAPYSTFTEVIQLTSSSSSSSREFINGSELASDPWLNPSYVAVVDKYYLQTLPNQEYIDNNVTFTLSTSTIAMNVTFYVNQSSNGNPSYGSVAVGYGTYFPASFTGNYGPEPPYDPDGIVVYLEHGAFTIYRLFAYYNGELYLNVSVGSINKDELISIGFWYDPGAETVYVYYYNGTAYTYKFNPLVQTSTGFKFQGMGTVNNDFIIAADNGGPTYGYGQWILYNLAYFNSSTTTETYSAVISYTAVTLGNGVKALYGFTGADNPVNISTNASSWSVIGIEKVENYSVSGLIYPVTGSVSYAAKSNGIYLLLDAWPSGDLDGWYLNVTIEFQFVTPQETIDENITIPVFIEAFAVAVTIYPPASSYLSGQTINVTNLSTVNFPSDLGYAVASEPVAEIEIGGITPGYVPLPYVLTVNVQVPTTYDYSIRVTEAGFVIGSLTGTITVYPVSKQPVVFVSNYPQSVTVGTKVTITFQFSYNSPVANVSAGAFIQKASTFEWAYARLVASSSLIEFDGYWASANDGLLIITRSNNYLIPFNGSAGLSFTNNSVNSVQVSVNSVGQLVVTANGVSIDIANTTPVIGIGFYYGAGSLDLKWVFVDGIILQSATANQAFVILTGTSTSTLSQYVSGYTNSSGFGSVTLTLTDTPYELVEIDWYGVTYVLLNISVASSTSATSSTVNVSTLNYNYTQPFNNIAPNSQLYNFSSYGPWPFIIGLVVVVVIALLGWKFGASAGALGGAVMGLIVTAYLGLLPWWLYYVFVLGIALLFARIFVNKFMGGEE